MGDVDDKFLIQIVYYTSFLHTLISTYKKNVLVVHKIQPLLVFITLILHLKSFFDIPFNKGYSFQYFPIVSETCLFT